VENLNFGRHVVESGSFQLFIELLLNDCCNVCLSSPCAMRKPTNGFSHNAFM
jgi:hypothetical protein